MMTKEEKRIKLLRMQDLIFILNKATEAYDKGEDSGYTDQEWDRLYFELQTLEKECDFAFAGSPTKKIHYEVKNELTKVEHNHPLLSLTKTKSIDDLNEFIGDKHYTVMAKMDGLTISVRYLDGKLVSAETRGNGLIGEDVLHNALTIKNLPHRIDYKEELIVDGEAIITYKDFEEFEDQYANPRNLVSGSIRLLDAHEAATRHISFVAWKVYKGFSDEAWFSRKLDRLDKLGFTTVPRINDDDYDQIIEPHDLESLIEEIRIDCNAIYGYPIDGCVIGIDNIKEAAAMGEATSHHEQYQIAFKFADDEYDTILKDITYDVSRNGQMTPVAVFEEVDTGDSTISRASLHNISVMHEVLGYPYARQKIKVIKSNNIIPQIIWGEKRKSNVDIYIPSRCPICGGETVIRRDGVADILYCGNEHCPARLSEQINHFCSKKGLDIHGLSAKTIDFLIDKGWLNSIKDLYNLEFYSGQWKHEKGWGEASVEKILSAIKESRVFPLDKFICAIGIREIGTSASKELAKKFQTWENFRKVTCSDLLSIAGFGEIMADEILNFDYAEADEIMEKYYIQPKNQEIKNNGTTANNSKLDGKIFVITGTLSKSRALVQQDIEKAGGRVTGSVSAKTSYLIIDDVNSTTGKAKMAREKNIPMISEEELYKMIGE